MFSFIPASVIARSIRFVGEAVLLILYGRKILNFLEHSLGLVNLLILSIVLLIFTLIWRTRFLQQRLLPFLQRMSQVWITWFTDLWRTVFSIGKFSWYLLTGATLTAFGFLFFTKLAAELLENELTCFDG